MASIIAVEIDQPSQQGRTSSTTYIPGLLYHTFPLVNPIQCSPLIMAIEQLPTSIEQLLIQSGTSYIDISHWAVELMHTLEPFY